MSSDHSSDIIIIDDKNAEFISLKWKFFGRFRDFTVIVPFSPPSLALLAPTTTVEICKQELKTMLFIHL